MYELFERISHLPYKYPDDAYYSTVYLGGEHTKISYTEVVPSLECNAVGFMFCCNVLSRSVRGLVDIAIGASGSETVIVENLSFAASQDAAKEYGTALVFPVQLPQGSRISVRGQCSYALVSTIQVNIVPILNGGFRSNSPLSCVDTYGANTSDSGGVEVAIGDGAFSSWTQITSSLTNSVKGFYLALSPDDSDSAKTSLSAQLEIGVGSSGNEVVVVDDWSFAGGYYSYRGGRFWPNYTPFFGIQIAEGERVSVRAKGSSDDTMDVILYGVR